MNNTKELRVSTQSESGKKVESLSTSTSILLICLLYAFVYALSLVTGIADVEFMGVDERSIITSLHGLFSGPLYNMTEQYHSKAYGWTYFTINFLVISPLKILQVENDLVYNFTIRATLFIIGILAAVTFYLVSTKFLSRLAAFVLTVLFLLDPVASHYFVTIHPETTGMLFYLLGVYFLFEYFSEDEKKLKIYMCALACFWLSALAKQPFAVTSVVTMVLFPLHYIITERKLFWEYLLAKEAWKILFLSLLVVIALLFVVNPYAILSFSAFVEGQMGPLSHSEGRPFEEAVLLWWNRLKESPLVLANFSLLLLLPFYKNLKLHSVFIFSVLTSSIVSILFMYMQKLIVSMTYLYPLFPIFLWNISHALKLLSGKLHKIQAHLPVMAAGLIVLIVGPYFFLHAVQSVYRIHAHFHLEDRYTTHVIYSYIETLPTTKKLLYMPTIAMPKKHKVNSCHVWRNCNTEQAIRNFEPDYILVNWNYPYFNPEILNAYMQGESYELIHRIKGGGVGSLNCGFPEYLIDRESSSQAESDVPREGGVSISEFHVLDNLSIVSMAKRIGGCVNYFQDIYSIDNLNENLGDDLEVWRRLR